MDFNTLKVFEINQIYKNNKTKFVVNKAFSKMKKHEKVELLNSVEFNKLEIDIDLITSSKNSSSKSKTFNKSYIEFFEPKKYKSQILDINEKLTNDDVLNIIESDLKDFVETLDYKVIKKEINKYGLIKAIMEFNSDKFNSSNYLFQITGSKSIYTSEDEIQIYSKLILYIIKKSDTILKKIAKNMNIFKTKIEEKNNSEDDDPNIKEYTSDIDIDEELKTENDYNQSDIDSDKTLETSYTENEYNSSDDDDNLKKVKPKNKSKSVHKKNKSKDTPKKNKSKDKPEKVNSDIDDIDMDDFDDF